MPDPQAAPPTLEVGTLVDGMTYARLSTLDGVEVIQGFQGGSHIWLAVKGNHFSDEEVSLTYGVRDARTQEGLTEPLQAQRYLGGGDDFLIFTAFLKPANYSAWLGRQVVLWAKGSSHCGQLTAEDAQETVIVKHLPPEGP